MNEAGVTGDPRATIMLRFVREDETGTMVETGQTNALAYLTMIQGKTGYRILGSDEPTPEHPAPLTREQLDVFFAAEKARLEANPPST